MTPLTSLWLPIVLSAVLVFVASSLVHMLLGWHKGDYPSLPDETRFADVVRPLAIPPGDYMVPRPGSMAEMRSPEFIEKRKAGPVMMITVFPTASSGWARTWPCGSSTAWVVSLFAAYVTGRAVGPGTEYLQSSASRARSPSSGTRSRCGRCRSGTGGSGARPSSRRSTG